MSSGVYGALSGALSRLRMMDTISDNLANAKTVGFKKGQAVFAAYLSEAASGLNTRGVNFADIREGFTDHSQGTLTPTGIPLHLAINGEGFFKIQDGEGKTYFTRQGMLRLDTEGNLVTPEGMFVIGEDRRPIQLPRPDVAIDEEGNVQLGEGETKKIPLFTFSDPLKLQRRGGGLFVYGGEDKEIQVERPRIFQKQIEESNLNMMQEMGRMIETVRSFEACQRMLKTYHEIAGRANEIGVPG